MSGGATVILILFGVFVLLLILNPNLSCFGKRIKSPFYPLLRKKTARKKTSDYRFDLGGEKPRESEESERKKKAAEKAEDYGFRLD